MPTIARSRRRFLAGAVSCAAALSVPRRLWPAQAPADRPLVPREGFFGDADVSWASLSFDGASVAYIAPLDGGRNLWVAPVGDLNAARPVTRVADRPIGRRLPGAER